MTSPKPTSTWTDRRAPGDPGLQRDPDALVFIVFARLLGAHRVGQELDAVGLDISLANGLEDIDEPVGCAVAVSQEIEIAGCPIRRHGPEVEQHRALEDESVRVLGSRQPVEEPFDRIT